MGDQLTLDQAEIGRWYRVGVMANAAPRLLLLGFVPLEHVCVHRRAKRKSGALIVQIGNASFALRPEEAKLVTIEPDPSGDAAHGRD